MGVLDLFGGGLSLDTFTPLIKKEMEKTGAKSFCVFFDKENKIQVLSFKENLFEEKKETERQLELLKKHYSELVEKLNEERRKNNGK